MKNKLILSVLGLAVFGLMGVNIYLNSQAQKLSDLTLSSIEASCCPGYEECSPKDQCSKDIIGC